MSKPPRHASSISSPPVAEQRVERLTSHGRTRLDPYYWMRERDDPAVMRHLRAENAYTDAVLDAWRPLRKQLLDEMRARIVPEQSSVPYRHGDYYYYHRYEEGGEYPLYCRRKKSLEAAEEPLLDANELAHGHDYFSLRGFTVSPDHRLAVFGVDTVGRRFYTLRFLNLETGDLLDERIEGVTSNAEWAADCCTLFYTRQDPDTLRDYQICRRRLGAAHSDIVYQEDDEAFWIGIEKSISERFLFLVSAATDSTEVRVLSVDTPDAVPTVFLPRQPQHEYYVTDGVDRYFVLSNDDAPNFRVFEAPLEDTGRAAWSERVPHRQNALLEGFDVFADHLVLSVIEQGLDRIEVYRRDTGAMQRVDVGEAVYTAYTHDNYCYASRCLRFSYETPTTPETTCDYDLAAATTRVVRREEVAGGFDASRYTSERIAVVARDGEQLPVTLAYRRGALAAGPAPLLLYGYGAYGISSTPDFDSDAISLLDRGFVCAIAHVRGGSELGRRWYHAGRQDAKENTFNDFIDVTRHLVESGYTASDRCYAAGGSAGGLLMGVIANRAPELYRGILAGVPFVDVLTTMLDESVPLTTGEYDEWGDPRVPDDFESMAAYSPYDNVRAQDYPALLITAGLHDSQVQYWEPAKWVAKLRAHTTASEPILLWIDMGAGHSGKTGRYRSLEDTALEYVFLLMLEQKRCNER